jgi:hypothetical protein
MDVPTLVFGTALTLLPLIAAGLLAAMVLLERPSEELSALPEELSARPAHGERGSARGRARGRRTPPAAGGRRRRT